MCENKYKNAVIYKIYCKNPEVKAVYIGSTISYATRMSLHKSSSKVHHSFLYQLIRQNGGWGNFQTEILEQCCVISNKQLLLRERFFINQQESKINIRIPGNLLCTTRKEYIRERLKEYQEKNKNKFSCSTCGFNTCNKGLFSAHCNTKKHQKNSQ